MMQGDSLVSIPTATAEPYARLPIQKRDKVLELWSPVGCTQKPVQVVQQALWWD